jgi:hypothetical protein
LSRRSTRFRGWDARTRNAKSSRDADNRRPGTPGKLDEETAAKGLHLKEGTQIMTHLFEQDSF